MSKTKTKLLVSFTVSAFLFLACFGTTAENIFFVNKKQELEERKENLIQEQEKLEDELEDRKFSIKMSEMSKQPKGKVMEISSVEKKFSVLERALLTVI